jgi:hypothetical protein
MTGLPMPVLMESDRTPGMSSMVSPSEAPWARRSVAPPSTAVGWATRRVSVATAEAVTCMVGSVRALSGRGRAAVSGRAWAAAVAGKRRQMIERHLIILTI